MNSEGKAIKDNGTAVNIVVANFMDSKLGDLERKGLISGVAELYNPDGAYKNVIHFSPYLEDVIYNTKDNNDKGLEVVSYNLRLRWPFTIFSSFYYIYKTIKQHEVSIVRGRLPYLGSLLGCLAAKLLGLPSVVSLGGDNRLAQERTGIYHYKSKALTNGIEYVVLRLADRIIAPNQFTKNYIKRIIGDDRGEIKTDIIPWLSSPISDQPNDFDVYRKFNIAYGSKIVPIIGFLNEYKYSDVLFEVLNNWKPEVDDRVCFLFCGDGPLREEGEELFRGNDNVRFLGWQEKSYIDEIIRVSSLVLIPMSGFVLLEVASLGRPIVTSNVEWHKELVKDGETGIVVDPDDVFQWRAALNKYLSDDELCERVATAVRKKFIHEFSPEVAKHKERELYISLHSNLEKKVGKAL